MFTPTCALIRRAFCWSINSSCLCTENISLKIKFDHEDDFRFNRERAGHTLVTVTGISWDRSWGGGEGHESHLTWSEGKGRAHEWVGAPGAGADCAKACGIVCGSRDTEANGGALGSGEGTLGYDLFLVMVTQPQAIAKLIHGQIL